MSGCTCGPLSQNCPACWDMYLDQAQKLGVEPAFRYAAARIGRGYGDALQTAVIVSRDKEDDISFQKHVIDSIALGDLAPADRRPPAPPAQKKGWFW